MKQILAAVDGSDASYRALRLATEIAKRFGSKLILVNVLAPLPVPAEAYNFAASDLEKDHREFAQRLLSDAAMRPEEPGVPLDKVFSSASRRRNSRRRRRQTTWTSSSLEAAGAVLSRGRSSEASQTAWSTSPANPFWSFTEGGHPMEHRRALVYAGTGVALAAGAPLGWLAWRVLTGTLTGGTWLGELAAHPDLYGYLLGGSSLAFVISGAIAGALADRLVKANRRLQDLAVTDDLTGLKNPRYFHEWLSVECARADRSGRPLTLVMADLDHFKRLNGRLGHAVGDEALKHAARPRPRGETASRSPAPLRVG